MLCRGEWDFNLKVLSSWEDTAQVKAYVGKVEIRCILVSPLLFLLTDFLFPGPQANE